MRFNLAPFLLSLDDIERSNQGQYLFLHNCQWRVSLTWEVFRGPVIVICRAVDCQA